MSEHYGYTQPGKPNGSMVTRDGGAYLAHAGIGIGIPTPGRPGLHTTSRLHMVCNADGAFALIAHPAGQHSRTILTGRMDRDGIVTVQEINTADAGTANVVPHPAAVEPTPEMCADGTTRHRTVRVVEVKHAGCSPSGNGAWDIVTASGHVYRTKPNSSYAIVVENERHRLPATWDLTFTKSGRYVERVEPTR